MASYKADADSDGAWGNNSKDTPTRASKDLAQAVTDLVLILSVDERDRAPGHASLCRAWSRSRQIVRSSQLRSRVLRFVQMSLSVVKHSKFGVVKETQLELQFAVEA